MRTESGVHTHNPEAAEIPLLLPAIRVGMDSRLHHRSFSQLHRILPAPTIPLHQLEEFSMFCPGGDTTLDAHKRRGKLKVRSEDAQMRVLPRRHRECAVEALLALTLLEQEVIAVRPLHHALAVTGDPDPLLGAAVGLQLRHLC